MVQYGPIWSDMVNATVYGIVENCAWFYAECMKKFLGGVIATLLVVVLGVIVARPALLSIGREESSSVPLGAAFQSIGELAVEEYVYSNVGSYDNKGLEIRGVQVPLTGKNFLITYDGVVKAGIADVEAIRAQVDDTTQTINITLPKVSVLSSQIKQESVEVRDQSFNPINQLRVEDITKFIAAEERNAEAKAIEHGLLERATQRTEELVRNHAEALKQGSALNGYKTHIMWE